MQIEKKPAGDPPYATPFECLGGEDSVKALVQRFYDLMDLEPAYAVLRAMHGNTLDNARARLFWFLCGWLGGPQYYTERFGHPRLRMRHLDLLNSGSHPPSTTPASIGVRERDQWLACMDQAMREIGVDEALRARLNSSFFQTADWMRNRGE